jgi:hypothetical protein
MADSKKTTVTKVYINNSKTPTTVVKPTVFVVVNNQLVPDFREENPGVKS